MYIYIYTQEYHLRFCLRQMDAPIYGFMTWRYVFGNGFGVHVSKDVADPPYLTHEIWMVQIWAVYKSSSFWVAKVFYQIQIHVK